MRPRIAGLSRTWRVVVDALADTAEEAGEHVDFLGRDLVEEEAADDVALDDGGLVEEALAGVGEEDEASATVALAGAAGDKVASFEARHGVGAA